VLYEESHIYFSFNFLVLYDNNFLAETALTTFLPVFSSISFRVLPAIVPPCLALAFVQII